MQLLWIPAFRQALSSTNSICHPHDASYYTLKCSGKCVQSSQAQEHWMLKKQPKSLSVPPKNPMPKKTSRTKLESTNQTTEKNQMTEVLSSSFGQQLAASLERAGKESRWGRELSLSDQIRTGKIIWLFITWINYHYQRLPPPFFHFLFPYLWHDVFQISKASEMQMISLPVPCPQASEPFTHCQYVFKGHKIHRNMLGAAPKYCLHRSWPGLKLPQ